MFIYRDHDSHPAEGVERPVAAAMEDFRHILAKNCGHLPWIENAARDRFYPIRGKKLPLGKGRTD
jgi:hypothetical protein